MSDISWLAEVVFFASYFIAVVTDHLGDKTNVWVIVSAIAALIVAVALVFFNGIRRAPRT